MFCFVVSFSLSISSTRTTQHRSRYLCAHSTNQRTKQDVNLWIIISKILRAYAINHAVQIERVHNDICDMAYCCCFCHQMSEAECVWAQPRNWSMRICMCMYTLSNWTFNQNEFLIILVFGKVNNTEIMAINYFHYYLFVAFIVSLFHNRGVAGERSSIRVLNVRCRA